jgi:Glycine zipper 2TM domain
MRKLILAMTALSVALPAVTIPTAADARRHHRVYRHYASACRHHSGTTGAIVGGGVGALVGSAVTHHGLAGPLIGGAGGALLGRHIERHSC